MGDSRRIDRRAQDAGRPRNVRARTWAWMAVFASAFIAQNAAAIPISTLIDSDGTVTSGDGTLVFSNFGMQGGGGCTSGPFGEVSALSNGVRHDANLFCGGGGDDRSITFDVTATSSIDAVELAITGTNVFSVHPDGHRHEGSLSAELSDSSGAFLDVILSDPIPAGFTCDSPSSSTGYCTFSVSETRRETYEYGVRTQSLSVEADFQLYGAGDLIGDPYWSGSEFRYRLAAPIPEPSAALLFAVGIALSVRAKKRSASPRHRG